MKRNVAIIGGGQTHHAARRQDVTQGEMLNEAVRRALADADMTMDEIEAVFLGNMELFEGIHISDCFLVDSTGALGKSGIKVTTGGTVGATITSTGVHYVASGLFDKVLCIGFEKQEEGDNQRHSERLLASLVGTEHGGGGHRIFRLYGILLYGRMGRERRTLGHGGGQGEAECQEKRIRAFETRHHRRRRIELQDAGLPDPDAGYVSGVQWRLCADFVR